MQTSFSFSSAAFTFVWFWLGKIQWLFLSQTLLTTSQAQ